MKKLLLLVGLCNLSLLTVLQAQTATQRCASDEYYDYLMQTDPAFKANQQNLESYTQAFTSGAARVNQVPVTIPVVVHVLYNSSVPAQNISDEQIKSQIDVLNEDYGAYNSDNVKVPPFYRSLITNSTIKFELASRDPNGNATNGITRTVTTVTGFQTTLNNAKHASTGGHDAWNRDAYLNLWVVPDILDQNGNTGVLGYAQFPGGTASTDGVVIGYLYFGRVSAGSPYHYGRTASHEVGHWLNLRHIWGDDAGACTGSDQVADTPSSGDSNFGNLTCANITCNNGPKGDMFMNYMDYTNDKYMYMFTAGQVARMQAAITGARAPLQTSNGLTNPSPSAVDAGIVDINSPRGVLFGNATNIFTPEVVLKNFGSTTLTSCDIITAVDALTSVTYNWTGSLAPGSTITVQLAPVTTAAANGDRLYYAKTDNPNGTTDGNTVNNKTTITFIGKPTTITSLIQSFDVTPFPPTGWSNKNYTCGTAWSRQTTASHSGAASLAFLNFSNTINGKLNEIYTPPVNLTTISNPNFNFWVAYAPKSATVTDTLELFISTDGGTTFTSLYKKWGSTLATVPTQTTAYTPAAADWRLETVDLSAYTSSPDAYIVFRNTSNLGNNLWIDDLDVTTGINEIKSLTSLSVFPNPSTTAFTVSAQFKSSQQIKLSVADMVGQVVYSKTLNNSTFLNEKVNSSSFATGIYNVMIETTEGVVTRKVSIVK